MTIASNSGFIGWVDMVVSSMWGVFGVQRIEAFRQLGQRDLAQAADEQGLGLVESAGQRRVDDLLDQTFRMVDPVTHGEHRRRADRFIDVAQAYLAQVGRDGPAAAMPLAGADVAALAQ